MKSLRIFGSPKGIEEAKKNYMDNKIVVSLVPLVLLFPLFKYFISFFICFSNAPLVMYVVRGLLSQNYA